MYEESEKSQTAKNGIAYGLTDIKQRTLDLRQAS